MVASVLISAVSLILLVYWFRYSCLLLITSNPTEKQAGAVARANRLAFLEVRKTLESDSQQLALDELYRSLESDYRILSYLLQNSTGLDMPGVEQRLMVLDYRLMELGYRVLRSLFPNHARQALIEMAKVIGFFSQKMGERVPQYGLVS
jgi:hypothetical protein